MKALLRSLMCLLLGLCAVLPLVGGDPGASGGGGETGVWILPRYSCLSSGPVSISLPLSQARDSRHISDPSHGVTFVTSNGLSSPVATLTERTTSTSVSLPVSGQTVTIPGSLLTGLMNAGARRANVLISDDNLHGYYIIVTFDSAGGADVYVF